MAATSVAPSAALSSDDEEENRPLTARSEPSAQQLTTPAAAATAAGDTLMGFGKFRNETFATAAKNAKYVEWALSQDAPHGDLKNFVSFLKQTPKGAAAAPPQSAEVAPAAEASSDEDERKPLAMVQGKKQEAPKRGLSAYMIWMNSTGRGMAKEAGETGIGSIGKWCGAKWKEMEAEEKAQWEEKAAADKARYEGEMSAYNKAKAPAAASARDEDMQDAASSDDEDVPLAERKRADAPATAVDSDEEDVPLAARKRPKQAARSPADQMALAVTIAKAALSLGAIGDHAGILSLMGTPITRQTPFEQQRNAYRQLAKLLHPDRLSQAFPGATKCALGGRMSGCDIG